MLHWLYDFSVIGGSVAGFGRNWMAGIPSLAVVLFAIVGSIVMFIRYRGRRFAEVMGD